MGKIYRRIDELIGKTPLIRLEAMERRHGAVAEVLAKLEYFNPAGSIKDRAARQMLDAAEAAGKITKDTVIIEPTSGNTGIGLAAVGTARGYRVIIVMPDSMSKERRQLIAALGAELVLTPGSLGMKGAIAEAESLASEYSSAFIPSQFDNPENAEAHRLSTGPEIYEDTDGKVDILVAGVGTGGTITGIGEYLKSKNPCVRIVAVEPNRSAVLSGEAPGSHGLQGIGAGFIPAILNVKIIDEVIAVSEEDAYNTARELGKSTGILVGISSGAALFAALKLAKKDENTGKRIVVILPDGGDRYLSSGLFEQDSRK